MIKIQKDGHFIICSNNSYETMYKRLGYVIVNEKQEEKIIKVVDKKQEEKIPEIPVIEIKKEEKATTGTKVSKDTKTKSSKNKK